MIGYGESELLGKTFSEITHPEDRSEGFEGFTRLKGGKIPGYQTEKRYIRKDGTPVWADVKVILVRDAHGHPLNTLAVISDITEHKLLQARLAEHGAQLQGERNFIDAILNTVGALILVIDTEESDNYRQREKRVNTGRPHPPCAGGVLYGEILLAADRIGPDRARRERPGVFVCGRRSVIRRYGAG